jgi:hypothetical protein
MALNFGVLDQGGPSNFFEGYSQGQEKMQANAMAQQKAAQAQQEFGMRQQEFAAGQADKKRAADAAMVTQRTLASRDALLRARTPDEARAIVRARHNDPYLGRISQQFGSVEADLAEVPDEPTAFQQYKEREAMGAEAFLKQQAGSREFATAMGGAQAMPQAAPTNAMAPVGPAAPAAPVNAMAAPAVSGELQNKLDQRKRLALIANQDPRVKANIDILDKEIARLSPAAPTPPASIAEFERAKRDPQFMRFLQERAAAIRPPAAPRPEPAPRTQQITLSDGSLGIVNMDTGVITSSTLAGAPVKGRPSATAEKAALQRKQLNLDLDRAIIELTDATKDGGLIDKSTGSGAGRLIDLAAGFGGKATSGAIAIGELQPIADMALKMVPRFEGPQSNADTTSYKQAAGQLADPTLPREIRKKAGKTVLRLMKDRKGQFASTAMEAEGVSPAPAAAGGVIDFGSLR